MHTFFGHITYKYWSFSLFDLAPQSAWRMRCKSTLLVHFSLANERLSPMSALAQEQVPLIGKSLDESEFIGLFPHFQDRCRLKNQQWSEFLGF